MHHRIVALESQHQPLPADGFDFPNTLTAYQKTSTVQELHDRIRNATIIISTTVKLDAAALQPEVTPHLQYVAASATGSDHIDLGAAKARGIRVTNCPGANLQAVSEHALSLYFASRRRTVLLDSKVRERPSEWKQEGSINKYMRLPDGSPPLTCKEEVLGIVGYGGLGKRLADLGRALGMTVLIAARKPSASASLAGALPTPTPDSDRVSFDEVLRRATVLVLALPRTPETLNLISSAELEKMHPYSVLINIARGGIVDEAAVVQALKHKQIAGYATDVYQVEPVGGPEDTPLLSEEAKDLNITMSPHLAWFSQRTLTNLGDILKATVEGWAKGEEINVIA
ncbi:D-isomer specific 2-hydroxyacid dehydrogenase [Phaeosphaeria sp. MPI-PUGE-AT-0046c]|nr:D-isomer specific 2-hydroxyacid dehydrogenase [Phaeosphaeria sp. MPI-PUGE-AT-0046c]